MKGPFGLLLIGGGIILLYGLFTGKITFSPGQTAPATTSSTTPKTSGSSIQPVLV